MMMMASLEGAADKGCNRAASKVQLGFATELLLYYAKYDEIPFEKCTWYQMRDKERQDRRSEMGSFD